MCNNTWKSIEKRNHQKKEYYDRNYRGSNLNNYQFSAFGTPPKLREGRPKRNCARSGAFVDYSDSGSDNDLFKEKRKKSKFLDKNPEPLLSDSSFWDIDEEIQNILPPLQPLNKTPFIITKVPRFKLEEKTILVEEERNLSNIFNIIKVEKNNLVCTKPKNTQPKVKLRKIFNLTYDPTRRIKVESQI